MQLRRILLAWGVVGLCFLVMGGYASHAWGRSEESVLNKLDALEKRIEDILIERVELADKQRRLKREIKRLRQSRISMSERIRRIRRHLMLQFRLLYFRGGNSWLAEIISGKPLFSLILRRAYMKRWSAVTKALLYSIQESERRLIDQQAEIASKIDELNKVQEQLLQEEESLRTESEKYISLLHEIRKDERKRALLQRELARSRGKLDQSMKSASMSNAEALSNMKLSCPLHNGRISNRSRSMEESVSAAMGKRGVWIESSKQEQELVKVYAPTSGRVVFSSRLKGFGETVIIKGKKDVFIVIAKLARRSVTKGMEVSAGDAIGTAGMNGMIYVEIRRGREPLDALPLLNCKKL